MTEESVATAAVVSRQRKKRKWDQPAESLIAAGLAVPGALPLGNLGSLVGITFPGVAPLSGALLTNTVPATGATVSQMFQAPAIHQNTVAIVQKLNQPKIQDELIAREIVINDAEPTVRYKLTKRQTQEEIQKITGAVVITRGKYRPPNGLPDNDKPLYLHISAGAHLKETAERIKAVDRAAVMVEEILKQGHNTQSSSTSFLSVSNTGGQLTQVTQPLSACVFLGFDADPSVNIAARIRGPNDQYINHIMNETGATVLLRGRGSRNLETHGEEISQPLHLFLSSHNPKGLEDAKLLAENLLDTISVECGASRVSSCKASTLVYNAVPPPHQLLAGVQTPVREPELNAGPADGSTCSTMGTTSVISSFPTTAGLISSATPSVIPSIFPLGTVTQNGGMLNYGQMQSNTICYPQSSLPGGTSYNGYGGIYPQATPLQQVALALRQPPAPITSVLAHTTSAVSTSAKMSSNSITETDKRPPQRRKFQELPVASKGPTNLHQNSRQGSEFIKPGVPSENPGVRNVSTMPPPKKLAQSSSNGMPPPPPRTMPPPPPKFSSSSTPTRAMPLPVPKFSSSSPLPLPLPRAEVEETPPKKAAPDPVSDTLVKLVEYGEEDDDVEGTGEESPKSNPTQPKTGKPFWAL